MTTISSKIRLRISFARGSWATTFELPMITESTRDPLDHRITCHLHRRCEETSSRSMEGLILEETLSKHEIGMHGKRGPPLTNVHHLEEKPSKSPKEEIEETTFTNADGWWVHHPHNDPLVITTTIGNMNVHRTFVDNGSSVDILYLRAYEDLVCISSPPHLHLYMDSQGTA